MPPARQESHDSYMVTRHMLRLTPYRFSAAVGLVPCNDVLPQRLADEGQRLRSPPEQRGARSCENPFNTRAWVCSRSKFSDDVRAVQRCFSTAVPTVQPHSAARALRARFPGAPRASQRVRRSARHALAVTCDVTSFHAFAPRVVI